jgi:hypothetical protein
LFIKQTQTADIMEAYHSSLELAGRLNGGVHVTYWSASF